MEASHAVMEIPNECCSVSPGVESGSDNLSGIIDLRARAKTAGYTRTQRTYVVHVVVIEERVDGLPTGWIGGARHVSAIIDAVGETARPTKCPEVYDIVSDGTRGNATFC